MSALSFGLSLYAAHYEDLHDWSRYEDLPTTGDSFEQQSILVGALCSDIESRSLRLNCLSLGQVLGAGNSALETADALAPYVNYV